MKISRNWLSDFVEWIETDPNVIADRMTRCMGEVDEVEYQGRYMDGVVIGRVQKLGKHPNADKLSVCDVETEQGVKHVVCGGTNLREGMLIAFAHVGSTVLAGGKEVVTLQKVKIRGEESEGMICAPEEVEIEGLYPAKPTEGNRPIADLTKGNFKVGTPLRKALGLNDVIFHIDNHAITNRADLFSHIGIAREMVAMGLAKWKKQQPKIPAMKFGKASLPFKLKNEVPDLVPQYLGCVIEVDGEGETPNWMKQRLEATGWRSVNLTVDITNYVLMEVGMPLHAFDIDDFHGTLHIRKAKKGEAITTLDNVKRALPENAVIISDDEGIFDLFGVMGGLRTSNKPTTKRIFLQAGVVLPISVRKTIVAMGHRTDASTVYEKGVPRDTAELGLTRALQLFLELAPGARITSERESQGKSTQKKPIKVSVSTICSVIGTEIKVGVIKKILDDLCCKVEGTTELKVTPPEWRNDLSIKQDIVEEVARIYGYSNVPPVMAEESIAPPARDFRIHKVRDSLKESGYFEMLHLAFASPELLRKAKADSPKAVAVENPLGEELSLMRTSLLPSLLNTLARELPKVSTEELKTYEFGHIFEKNKESSHISFAVGATGKTTIANEPLLILKNDMNDALAAAGHIISVKKLEKDVPASMHGGRAAEIFVGDKRIGIMAEVHPQVRSAFGLQFRAAVADIDLDALMALAPTVTIGRALPLYPAVELDETIDIGSRSHEELLKNVRSIDPMLKDITVLHLYEKDAAVRNITLRFTYRADERTLTQEEVEKVHAKVAAEIRRK